MVEKYASLTDEYKDVRPLYEQYSDRVEQLIKLLVDDCDFTVHSISSRTKEIESFEGKIWRKGGKYTKLSDITDLSGIRIICYLLDQVDKVADIIKENFSINYDLSIDKSQMLEADRFGYLSLHYVVTLPEERTKWGEYKKFKDMHCEIQIRSILQHSWAEIEHDLGYKSSIEVPKDIKRRFYRLAGLLELADDEFNSISKLIDDYSMQVSLKTKAGDLDIAIDSTSLDKYFDVKFAEVNFMNRSFGGDDPKDAKDLIQHLFKLGINTIQQLDDIIPSDFIERYKDHPRKWNYYGLLIDIMVIAFKEKYFEEAWDFDSDWTLIDPESTAFLESYGVNMDDIVSKYGLTVMDISYD